MNNVELLLAEYNNLWQEKIAHKANLRKLKGYVSYLTSIVSGSITVFGLSSSDIFKTLSQAKDASALAKNITNALNVISIPAVPIILLIGSFAINELFQIYVIGNHIGNLEAKINKIVNSDVFSWEHKVCPVVYGGKITKSGLKITNVIAYNDLTIFFPFIGLLTIAMAVFALKFLYSINLPIFYCYLTVLLLLFFALLTVGWKLGSYTRANSSLTRAINEAGKS